MERIQRIFKETTRMRGSSAESRVRAAVCEAIEQRIAPEWLIGYYPADRDLDRKGIDAQLDTDVGWISIQIKSSERGRIKALEHHPKIPVVVVPAGLYNEEILSRFLESVEPEREKYLQIREERMLYYSE